MRRSVYCTVSFSVCSRRRTELPIICHLRGSSPRLQTCNTAQVTSTVGNNKESKLAFFRYIADELKKKLSVRPDDIMINTVFVDRSDWSFGNGDPWT